MRKLFLLLSVLFFFFLVWSCKKFLNINPQSGQTTDADFFKNKADFEAFMFGAYAEMAGDFDTRGVTNWIMTPGYISQDLIGSDELTKPPAAFISPSNTMFKEYWAAFYRIATKTNLLLSRIGLTAMAEGDKKVISAEAKCMRGFAYFNLARAFGNVPLILEPYDPSQNNVECTPAPAVFDQVIIDLSEAARDLPTRADWGPANIGRVTKGTALAYLANAYMYKEDWANAEKVMSDLVNLNEYHLLPNVRDVFSEKTPNNDESIFEIQYRNISDGNVVWSGFPNAGTVLPAWTAPRGVGDAYAHAGGWGETIANRKLANSFDPNDDRRIQLIKNPGEKYKGETMSDTLIIPLSVSQPTASFSTKYWLGPQLNVGQTYLGDQNIPLMRYAETLLNYAEILFRTGKINEAYEQLNLVRERAKLDDLPVSADEEIFMDAIMNERRHELNFETNLWFHYTRTGKAAEFLLEEHGLTMDPKWNLFPIPQSERDQNPKLCQNQGY